MDDTGRFSQLELSKSRMVTYLNLSVTINRLWHQSGTYKSGATVEEVVMPDVASLFDRPSNYAVLDFTLESCRDITKWA